MKIRRRAGAVAALFPLIFTQCSERKSPPPVVTATPPPIATPALARSETARTRLRGATTPDPALVVPPGFPAVSHQPREFDALSEAGRKTFAGLEAEFWRNPDPERRAAILDEVEASCYGEEMLGFAAKLLDVKDEAVRLQAIEMLSGNTSAAIIPILEKALADPSEAVRLNAVAAVAQVRDDSVVDFLGKAFEDKSEEVRTAGLEVIDQQTEARKLKVLGRALQATHPDVQTAAIGSLQMESTPKSVEVLFQALDASDPEVRSSAQFSLDFLVDHEFASAAEARAWWKENRQKFDEDLVPKE